MATVPVASPQVDSAAVPPQYAQANDYTAQRINRQAFNQVQQGGADVQRASTDVSNIALQTAIDDNERKTKDLDTQYSQGLGKIGFGDGAPENPGFYQQQGQNALTAAPAAKAAVAKLQAELSAKAAATNPEVAKLFARTAGQRTTDFENGIDRHTAQERLAANNQTSEARVAQAGKDAALYWNDPKALGQQMGIAAQETADAGLRNGWDKDTVAYKTTLAQSGIIRGAVNGALSAGSISTAQSILNANKDSVDGAVQLSIVQDIKQAENAQRIQQEHEVAMADHYQRQAQDKAFGEVAADVMQNKGDANTIANMTRSGQLNPSQGITLSNMLKAADKPDPMSHVSAATSQSLFKGIADGTITTRAPIDDAFSNGQLSRPDHDWLITQQADGLNPDGKRLNKAQGDFVKLQESNIINPDAKGTPLGNRQNEGAYEYTRWVNDQVAATKAAGKDPMKLFDPTPGNADYLGTPGKISAFKQAYHLDMTNDFANFGIDPSKTIAPAPAPGILSSITGAIFGKNNELTGFDSLDSLKAAQAKGAVTRDWAKAYALDKGWIRQ